MRVLVVLLLTAWLSYFSAAEKLYRYKLETGDINTLCPRKQMHCNDGRIHFLCKPHNAPAANCKAFKLINLNARLKRTFINAHNGIRSKVAADFSIANMNLLYWSRDLAIMAEAHVYECRVGDNMCNTIGTLVLPVGQNYLFRDNRLVYRWPGHVVRHWYLELGLNMHNWQDVLAKYNSGGLRSFIQLTWPQVEFIGCAAARMSDGVYIVCYYYPPFNATELTVSARAGQPCHHCPEDRPTCSRVFVSLCGIDVPLMSACTRLAPKATMLTLALLLLWLFRYCCRCQRCCRCSHSFKIQ